MRVYYLCNWTGESGGIKTLYDHVRLLRRGGVDAALASYGAFERCTWFEHDAREAPGLDGLLARLGPDDLVVLPDFCMRDAELAAARCRQVVLVQNPDLMTGPADATRYEALVVTSAPLVDWVRAERAWDGPLHVVPGFLERALVLPARTRERDPPRCLVVDRVDKHRGEPLAARAALAVARLPVTCLDERMPRARFVRHFAESDAYLHLSYREGYPVSVLEAFGAGCLVVGFSGRGGLHFMRHGENCLVVDDGDWRGALASLAALLRGPSGRRDALRAAARATALAQTEDATARSLHATFSALGLPLAGDGVG